MLREHEAFLLNEQLYHNLESTSATNDYLLMMRFFVCCKVKLWLFVGGIGSLLMRLAASSLVVMGAMVFDLEILILAVVLQSQTMSLGVFSLWMNELQLMLVGADLDWMMQIFLVLLLHVDGYSVVMDELDWLMWFSVFVIDLVMMFCLWWARIGCGFMMISRVLVNDAGECNCDEWE